MLATWRQSFFILWLTCMPEDKHVSAALLIVRVSHGVFVFAHSLAWSVNVGSILERDAKNNKRERYWQQKSFAFNGQIIIGGWCRSYHAFCLARMKQRFCIKSSFTFIPRIIDLDDFQDHFFGWNPPAVSWCGGMRLAGFFQSRLFCWVYFNAFWLGDIYMVFYYLWES